MSMTSAVSTVSAWRPLRVTAFRALWLAVLASNIGTWMQTVGAQWLLVGHPNASTLDHGHTHPAFDTGREPGLPILVPDVIIAAHEAASFARDKISEEV